MFLTDYPEPGKEIPDQSTVTFVESSPRVLFPSPVAAMIAAAEKGPVGKSVRVRVVAPYRVCHEGKAFVGGQIASVPAETAEKWIKSGWVKPVAQKGKK